MADDDARRALHELAERGHQKGREEARRLDEERAAADAKRYAERTEAERRGAARVSRAVRNANRLGSVFQGVFVAALVAGIAFATYVSDGRVPHGDHQPTVMEHLDPHQPWIWPVYGLAGATVVLLVLVPILRLRARRRSFEELGDEVAWASSRPFRIAGYPQMFTGEDMDKLSIEVHYRGTPPEAAFLTDAVHGVHAGFMHVQSGACSIFRLGLENVPEDRRGLAYVRAVHDVIDRIVAVMNDEHPVERVHLELT